MLTRYEEVTHDQVLSQARLGRADRCLLQQLCWFNSVRPTNLFSYRNLLGILVRIHAKRQEKRFVYTAINKKPVRFTSTCVHSIEHQGRIKKEY